VLRDEAPDLLFGPFGQWADLHQTELLVPADDRHARSVGALVAANGAGPGLLAEHRLVEHLDLAMEAALVGVCPIDRSAVLRFILFDRSLRPFHFHRDAIPPQHFLAQLQRLLELIACIEIEDRRLWRDLGQHVDQHHAFRAERRGHRELLTEPLSRPPQNLLRLGAFQAQ
jgi:hypothetical protein